MTGSPSARTSVTAAVVGIVAAQAVATVLSVVGLGAFRRFPAAAPERLGGDGRGILGSSSPRVSRRASSRCGALARPCSASSPSRSGRLLPHRAGAATGSCVAERARAADHAHRADAGLGRGVTASCSLASGGTRRGRDADGSSCRPPTSSCPARWALYGQDYEGASDAARLVLLAAALQLVFGWSKSFPVSIGRGLRVLAHGVESAVMIPLVVVLGHEWGARGGRGGVLAVRGRFLPHLGRASRTDQATAPARREGLHRDGHLATGRRRPRGVMRRSCRRTCSSGPPRRRW